MTKEEWKTRCAAQYMKRGGLTQEQAVEMAEVCFESQDGEFSELADYDPEQCADDDMGYWTDDGED